MSDFTEKLKINSPANDQLTLLNRIREEAYSLPPEHLKWSGDRLTEAFGLWNEGIGFVTGVENGGKSSWLLQRVGELIDLNDDCAVIDVSIDDSETARMERYVGVFSGLATKLVSRPVLAGPNELKRRDSGFDRLGGYIADSRLRIASTKEGQEIYYLSNILNRIRQFRQDNGDKKIVAIVDSLSDIRLPDSRTEEPEKIILQELDTVLKECKAIGLMTAHRRKSGSSSFTRVVSNEELKGSAFIKYFAKTLCVLHNEMKAKRQNAEMFWCDPRYPHIKLPVIELSVQKNKTSDFDDWIFFKFDPKSGKSIEANTTEHELFKRTVTESLSRPSFR